MFILVIFSCVSGYFLFDLFVGYGTDLFNLNINLKKNFLLEQEYISQFRKPLPLIFVSSGIIVYIFSNSVYITCFNLLLKYKNYFLHLLLIKNFLTKK